MEGEAAVLRIHRAFASPNYFKITGARKPPLRLCPAKGCRVMSIFEEQGPESECVGCGDIYPESELSIGGACPTCWDGRTKNEDE